MFTNEIVENKPGLHFASHPYLAYRRTFNFCEKHSKKYPMTTDHYDIVIIGGGPVGMALTLTLRDAGIF